MKNIIVFLILINMSLACLCQVRQLVMLRGNTFYLKRSLIGQTKDSVIYRVPDSRRDTYKICKENIVKTQTYDVRFINDEYNTYLSGGNQKLAFEKLSSTGQYGIDISGRIIGSDVILMIRLHFGLQTGNEYRLVLSERDTLKITTKDGDLISLPIKDVYMLQGKQVLYNFGYVRLSKNQVTKLMTDPVADVKVGGQQTRIADEYCIMRHLFALLEEKGFY